MAALPADVAKYTNDGVVLTTNAVTGAAIKAAHPDARDLGVGEIEMFWVDPNHAQIVLDERFGLLSKISPLHVGIEVEESLKIGVTVPIAPITPSFRAVDEPNGIDVIGRTRSFSRDPGTNRNSVELVE